MELGFDSSLVENYNSNAQKARVLTEMWVAQNMYCPRCGSPRIHHFPNNRPVADFYCPVCSCEYELKSKQGPLSEKVVDGAYTTMIERITSNQNPDFLFLGYDIGRYEVKNLLLIPKHFFVPEIIEKRRPLAETARRAGWVGCNILIGRVPEQGRIPIISNGIVQDMETVIRKVELGNALKVTDIRARGWLMDILNCVNRLPTDVFSLSEMYSFEGFLEQRHVNNHNIRPKIRQQLQVLRDKGVLEFLGNGKYRKVRF